MSGVLLKLHVKKEKYITIKICTRLKKIIFSV